MSREIVSAGNHATIAWQDRSFGGGTPKDVWSVNGDTGEIQTGAQSKMTIGSTVQVASATVTVGALATDNRDVTLQLFDGKGDKLTSKRNIVAWLSATAGATSVGTSTTGLTTSITTGIAINVPTANLVFNCLTDATGKLVVNVLDAAGGETRYVNFLLPDGTVLSSAAVVTA